MLTSVIQNMIEYTMSVQFFKNIARDTLSWIYLTVSMILHLAPWQKGHGIIVWERKYVHCMLVRKRKERRIQEQEHALICHAFIVLPPLATPKIWDICGTYYVVFFFYLTFLCHVLVFHFTMEILTCVIVYWKSSIFFILK